jgi:hypothetical protein
MIFGDRIITMKVEQLTLVTLQTAYHGFHGLGILHGSQLRCKLRGTIPATIGCDRSSPGYGPT